MFKHKAEGSIDVVFLGIPAVLFVSKSTVIGKVKKGKGLVYTLHITPFIGIGLIIPSFFSRVMKGLKWSWDNIELLRWKERRSAYADEDEEK